MGVMDGAAAPVAPSGKGAYQLAWFTTGSSKIYQSADYGATWSQIDTSSVDTSSPYGFKMAQSADGQKILRIQGGFTYLSTNGGASWTQQTLS